MDEAACFPPNMTGAMLQLCSETVLRAKEAVRDSLTLRIPSVNRKRSHLVFLQKTGSNYFWLTEGILRMQHAVAFPAFRTLSGYDWNTVLVAFRGSCVGPNQQIWDQLILIL